MIRKSEIIMGNFIFCLLRICRSWVTIAVAVNIYYRKVILSTAPWRKKMQINSSRPSSSAGLITSKYLDNLADYFVNYFCSWALP